MSFQFRPARREGVPLLIGLAGASGSGKTFSALELASGIAEVEGGKIAFIDTENRRGLHYADRFEFMHAELDPPFRPERYGEAIRAAEAAGAAVVVVDSFSHEYEGEGGILDWANQEEADGKKPPSQWIKPKSAHKGLVNLMLRAKPHIIVCLRAEEKMQLLKKPKLDRDGNQEMWKGKPAFITEVIAAGDRPLNERWQPICEKRFPYEITTSLLLLPGQPGVPIPLKLQEQHKPAFGEGPITRESGRFLASWAKGGTPPAPANASTSESPPRQRQTAEEWTRQYVQDVEACQDIDALMKLQAKSGNALARLRTEKPDLHKEAVDAGTKRAMELQGATA
ncbi:MAG TPA: AAA family ATPase [Xanthobacteraceae bacterium]|nr:AAA family ATPase [Xanthobacteraceae bacterium]